MNTIEIPAKEWNAEKGKMEDTFLPEWQRYYQELERHQTFCDNYKLFLDRICKHLEWLRPSGTWTTDDIRTILSNEIDRNESMGAPNKPGYFRANND